MKRRPKWLLPVVVIIAIAIYAITHFTNRELVLTGIVTTDTVIVSSEIAGRIDELKVQPGDVVKKGDVLATIAPKEWQADVAYYENNFRGLEAQVKVSQTELKLEEQSTAQQIKQAEANLATAQAQTLQAQADLENAHLNFDREKDLHDKGAESTQAFDQARANFDSAKARVDALQQQTQAAGAALELARANAAQIDVRRASLDSAQRQLDAAGAQRDKASVHLGYTAIPAPINGVVDVRAALSGEVVNAGQPIVTLVNPDDLWIRADVEETYVDRIHLGDTMTVRLPSGATRPGKIFYRGVDADYATQRDVSRTKRDIKTFEIRLRCDNQDRSLAVGMTAYVLLLTR